MIFCPHNTSGGGALQYANILGKVEINLWVKIDSYRVHCTLHLQNLQENKNTFISTLFLPGQPINTVFS